MTSPALLLIAAFGLDLALGDPNYPWHPVRLFGLLIQHLERQLRAKAPSIQLASWLLPGLACALVGLLYLTLHRLMGPLALLLDLYLLYALLALGDLLKHARAVEFALKHQSLESARKKVQWMVGRDTRALDPFAVARAAIESVAENFVDGFFSPLFWFALGAQQNLQTGILLLLLFKVVSTLDSMVGYKNERYRELGRISAKLDDALNFIPARLSIPLIAIFSQLITGKGKSAWKVGLRDRKKHPSPNSAHAEAAMAGALGLRIGGPVVYHSGVSNHPWLGRGTPDATSTHIGKACRIVLFSGIGSTLAALALLIPS